MFWKSRGSHSPDGRRIVTKRRVGCTGCGAGSIHFQALWLPDVEVFAVPYVALNGGTGEEIHPRDAEEMNRVTKNRETEVWMSECCFELREKR